MAKQTNTPAKVNKKWGTVKEAAYNALYDLGETEHRLGQFIHWGLECAKDWHIDMAREIKPIETELNGYKAIDLPDDYLDWVVIGVRHGDLIRTFVNSKSIPLTYDCEDGEIQPNQPLNDDTLIDTLPVDFLYGTFNQNWEDVGRLFGLAHKDNGLGYFKEYREKNQIQFRTDMPAGTKIYLEYISDGWSPCSETYLHPYAMKLVKLYIHWQNLKYNKNVPRVMVQEAKIEYNQEFDRVSWRMFDLTIEDVLDVFRESYSLAPKT